MNIDELIISLKQEHIYFKPNPGNGGDALIAYAAYKLFQKHGIKYTIVNGHEDLSDKVVIYNGGGNLVEYYKQCSDFIKKHKDSVRKLILFPHTISGHQELLSSLKDNVIIVCREQTSFSYIKTFPNIKTVYLIEDLVLSLDIKSELKKNSPTRLLFLVKIRSLFVALLKRKKNLGFFLKKRTISDTLNAFREDVEQIDLNLPSDNLDITALINLDPLMMDEKKVKITTKRIFNFINMFSVINTNRLHACITAAKLGKTVNFYDNSYHKNKSVYEFSLKDRFPNVVWKGNRNDNAGNF